MTSVREEWGMTCPTCDRDDNLLISAIVTVSLTPNGTIETEGSSWSGHEWDNDCSCSCGHCGHYGQVKHFKTEERP